MTTLHTMVGAALAAVCILPLAQQGGAQPPKPTIVAVVDIEKAIENYPRWLSLKEQLEQMDRGFRARLNELRKDVDEAKARIQATLEDTLDRKQAEFEYDNAIRKGEWERKFLDERMRLANAQFATVCYQDVGEVIAKVAKARGVQLVHRMLVDDATKVDPLTLAPGKLGTLSRMLDSRQVWYAAPDVDLTSDVIKELQVWKPKEKADKADAAGTTSGAPKADAPKESGAGDPKAGDPKGTSPKGGG